MDLISDKAFRVLLVDDDEDYCVKVQAQLQERGYFVDCAHDVPSARRLIDARPYDLYLLDLIMPGTSGKVLCRELATQSVAGIIVVSSISDDAERIALLELGADDYIVKPFNALELLARVRSVLRRSDRNRATPRQAPRFGPWALVDGERHLKHEDGRVISLTSSEAEILRFFVANPNMLCTREDILAVARVRQYAGANDRSVDTLIRRLRKKVEVDPGNPRLIETVWGQGYVFRPG
ncbi:response regulator [Acuticoccus kandeliae]|uniref:response regulator n=1 Tax=Acuticoccus kandeliae TaxID=2073160 RepID=UPI001475B103|nr:response regulator transcription factor [Acuticoccus kandeliae]